MITLKIASVPAFRRHSTVAVICLRMPDHTETEPWTDRLDHTPLIVQLLDAVSRCETHLCNYGIMYSGVV